MRVLYLLQAKNRISKRLIMQLKSLCKSDSNGGRICLFSHLSSMCFCTCVFHLSTQLPMHLPNSKSTQVHALSMPTNSTTHTQKDWFSQPYHNLTKALSVCNNKDIQEHIYILSHVSLCITAASKWENYVLRIPATLFYKFPSGRGRDLISWIA